mgnify:CR=1 FL=1
MRYKIDGGEIIGFMPNIKFASFRNEVSPMTFYVWGKYYWGGEVDSKYYAAAYVRVKAGSDLRAAMKHIQASLKKIDPVYPFKVSFYDEILQRTYVKELKISNLITLFSVIAILISIVGVFGLVVFESEYRRKEVAVRKVLGSSTPQILVLFNRSYLVGSCGFLWRISLVGELCLPYSDVLVGISGSLYYCFGYHLYNRNFPELACR